MSRGLGRVQRDVLEAARAAVDEDGIPQWVRVDQCIQASAATITPAQRESVKRAMRSLTTAGHVERAGRYYKDFTGRETWGLMVRLPLTPDQQAVEDTHLAALIAGLGRNTT